MERCQRSSWAWLCGRAARSLLLGQIISFLIAVTGICSTELAKVGFNAPLFQSLFNYVLLACTLPASWGFRRAFELLAHKKGAKERTLAHLSSQPSFVSLPLERDRVKHSGDSDLSHRNFWDGLHSPWWIYLASAVVDVEANFTVVLAYQYTSVTSVGGAREGSSAL